MKEEYQERVSHTDGDGESNYNDEKWEGSLVGEDLGEDDEDLWYGDGRGAWS